METFFVISILFASSYFLYTVIIEKKEKKKLPSKTENKTPALPTGNTGASLRRQPEWARQLEEKKKKDLEAHNTKEIEKTEGALSGNHATPIDSTSKEESLNYLPEPGLTKEGLKEKKEKIMEMIEDILKDSSPRVLSLQQLKEKSGRVMLSIDETIQENSQVPESDSHEAEPIATAEQASGGIDSRFKRPFTFEITGGWETVDDPEAVDVEDEDPDPIRKLALKAVRSMEAEMSASQLVYSVTTASSAVRELQNGVLASNMDYDQALKLGKSIDQSNAAHLFTDELVNITEIIANTHPEMSREVNRAFADIAEQYE